MCSCGQARVERHPDEPRLEAGEVKWDRVQTVVDEQTDRALGRCAQRDQGVRDATRELVYLGERQRLIAIGDSCARAMLAAPRRTRSTVSKIALPSRCGRPRG